MEGPIYRDVTGRPYTVRDGVSVWLDEQRLEELPPLAPQIEYVGFGRRAAAQAIDLVVTYALAFATSFLIAMVAYVIAMMAGFDVEPLIDNMARTTPGAWVFSFLAVTMYHAVAEAMHGSTPGKMMLGITVRSAGGGFCGFGQALKRSVAFLVDSLFFGLPAWGSMRDSPLKQRIGDKWARTIVVRSRSLDAAERRTGLRFLATTVVACSIYSVIAGASMFV